jgi:superfamily I DNA/RNA helicase
VALPSFSPDPAQSRVLSHARGPLLVTGAAGTGKTTLLRERFASLIDGGADPERIALVVRSKRARDEARAALLRRLGRSLPGLPVTTIQGLAFRLVTRRFSVLGYPEPPKVLDADDQFAVVQELLRGEATERTEDWPTFGSMLHLRGFADEVRQLLLRAQEALIGPDEMAALARGSGSQGWSELAGFYRRYLQVLDAQGAVDFAGLVEQAAVAAAAGDPEFDHVLVDDFQEATLGIERLLAELRPEALVVAGDPDAHVFSFQGTTDVPIRRFVERFAAEQVVLETPHRGPRPTIVAWRAPHTSEEHAAVARELRRIHVQDGIAWSDLAVIVRRWGPHVAGLLRALDDAGVPRTSSDPGLTAATAPAARPYVLALRWIAAVPDRRDDLIEAVLASELGGLSPASARSLLRATRAAGLRPSAALTLRTGIGKAEARDLDTLETVLLQAEEARASVLDAFRVLWQELPCSRRLVEAAGSSHRARADLDAVVAFARLVTEAGTSADPSIESFLDLIDLREGSPSLAAHADRGREAVEVLTAHASAGLEFDTVVVVGAVEGNFPSLSRPEPMFDLDALSGRRPRSEITRTRLADERRLFATALARARRRVVLSGSDPHGLESHEAIASRFVEELGVTWSEAPLAPPGEPVSVPEAVALWRRTLADPLRTFPDRLATLPALLALGADPGRWWHQREWTDTGEPLHERPYLSYSRLDHLENCELQYLLGDELGLDPSGGYQAWVGRLVHQLIERCERGEIERTPEALIAALEERWQPTRFPSYAISEAERRHAIQVLIPNWFERYGELPADASERRFHFELEGAVISGVIDRIGQVPEGGRRITDFKTGSSDNAGRAADNLQLGIYYLAVGECEDLAPFRPVDAVELAFLPGKKHVGRLVTHVWEVRGGEEEYKARMRTRLLGLIERVRRLDEAGRYVPNSRADCFFCRFQTLCPRYPEGGEVFPIDERDPSGDAGSVDRAPGGADRAGRAAGVGSVDRAAEVET